MSQLPPPIPVPSPESSSNRWGRVSRGPRFPKGYFAPKLVRAVSFYIITLCIVASVVACILAIWDFAQKEALWRLIASCLVVATGMALFSFVNGIFGEEKGAEA